MRDVNRPSDARSYSQPVLYQGDNQRMLEVVTSHAL